MTEINPAAPAATSETTTTGRKGRGATPLEMGIFLIIFLAIVGFFGYLQLSQKDKAYIKASQDALAALHEAYTTGDAQPIKFRRFDVSISKDQIEQGLLIVPNTWGGTIATNTNAVGMAVTLDRVPADACVSMIWTASGLSPIGDKMSAVSVNGELLGQGGAIILKSDAEAACADNSTLTWAFSNDVNAKLTDADVADLLTPVGS